MILIFLLCILIITSILIYFWSSKKMSLANKLPGPKPLPVIGNSLEFIKSRNILEKTSELCREYGPVLRLWLGNEISVVLSDPRDIAAVLSKAENLNKSGRIHLLESWLGKKSLFTAKADDWRVHRKLLNPLFSLQSIKHSLSIMEANTEIFCDQLKSKIDGPEFDIEQYIERCTFDIICEAAMGVKLGIQQLQNHEYFYHLNILKREFTKRTFYPWLHSEMIYKLTNNGRRYYESLNFVRAFVRRVIKKRRNSLIGSYIQDVEDEITFSGDKTSKTLLDLLLHQNTFSDQEIEDEVHTFMFAGHDTIKTAVSFCLYSLSQNLVIQERLAEEIQKFLQNKKIGRTYEDYNDLKYLECVVKETLRMYTPAPLITRKVENDLKLPSGHTLPAQLSVMLNLWYMHNNPKVYENPNQFHPDRFLHDDKTIDFIFMPFSHGPRICIGQKFALLEVKVILTKLLEKYHFLPANMLKPLHLENSAVLHSLEAIKVKVKRRC